MIKFSLMLKFLLAVVVIFTATSSVALAKQTNDELRAELNQMSQAVLDKMEKKYPLGQVQKFPVLGYFQIYFILS